MSGTQHIQIFRQDIHRSLTGSKWIIPESENVETIYRAYRQCYSQDPMHDGELSAARIGLLLEMIHAKAHRFKTAWGLDRKKGYTDAMASMRMFDLYGQKEVLQHWHRCLFIKEHLNHQSCLEHGILSVRIGKMTRACSHQQVRHRIGMAVSQQSQRYVDLKNPDMLLTKRIRQDLEATEIIEKHLRAIPRVVKKLTERPYNQLQNEDLRAIFPNATCTQMVVTFNYRALLHYFEERCCMCAEPEIRDIANTLLHHVQTSIPIIFDEAGPKCLQFRICPESTARSCHRFITKEELFARMHEFPDLFRHISPTRSTITDLD